MRGVSGRFVSSFVLAGLVMTLLACGGGDADVPTADDLLARVVTAADLGPDWSSSATPPSTLAAADRSNLPVLELCPDATDAARAQADGLVWQVRSGADHTAASGEPFPSLVILLLADDPDTVTETFDVLRDRMTDCLPTDLDSVATGPVAASALDLPDVGDDRFGVRYQQPDDAAGAERWDRRDVIVRDGAVMMWFSVVEVTTDEARLSDAAFEAALVVAADRMTARTSGSAATVPTTAPTQIANPASVFCEEQGGTVEIVDEAGGQLGYCNLPDGRRIEEWEFFRSSTTVPTSEP